MTIATKKLNGNFLPFCTPTQCDNRSPYKLTVALIRYNERKICRADYAKTYVEVIIINCVAVAQLLVCTIDMMVLHIRRQKPGLEVRFGMISLASKETWQFTGNYKVNSQKFQIKAINILLERNLLAYLFPLST